MLQTMLVLWVVVPLALGRPAEYDQFRRWMEKYGRQYDSAAEEALRYKVFSANLANIEAAAQANPLAHFEADEFADATREELTARGSSEAFDTATAPEQPAFPEYSVAKARATAIDWVTRGAVNKAVSQGRCGTCAQFSATANIEAQWFLAGHELVKLSEQEMIDCSSYTGPYAWAGLQIFITVWTKMRTTHWQTIVSRISQVVGVHATRPRQASRLPELMGQHA